MKPFVWMLGGPVALVGLVLPCAAQSPSSFPAQVIQTKEYAVTPVSYFRNLGPRSGPCAPGMGATVEPSDPSKPADPAPPTTSEGLSGLGAYKGTFATGTAMSAAVGIGAAVASASAGLPVPANNARTATLTSTSTPLIMPGLFSALSSQSVIPLDRVSFDYGYTHGFAITSPTGPKPGFNLNMFNIGFEKTFVDGLASVYVSVPFLYATENISGQAIDGLGDVSVGLKVLLWTNQETGSAISGGFTVAAPTARDTTITSTQKLNVFFTGGTQPALVPMPPAVGTNLGPTETRTTTTTVNPTYLQPWVGGLFVRDRLFIHEYFGVMVPTDDRVATIINNNLTFGYELFSDTNRFVTSFTPIFGVQLLLPVSHVNNSAGSTTTEVAVDIPCTNPIVGLDQLPGQIFGFPTQVFLSAGAQMGLGERCMFNAGVVVPVVGPRGYEVGATFGLNYLY